MLRNRSNLTRQPLTSETGGNDQRWHKDAALPGGRVWEPRKDRRPGPVVDVGLPVVTEVFSADYNISLAEDIFYERFPDSMKERAPA